MFVMRWLLWLTVTVEQKEEAFRPLKLGFGSLGREHLAEFHGQAHVAAHLELALHEEGLTIGIAQKHVDEIICKKKRREIKEVRSHTFPQKKNISSNLLGGGVRFLTFLEAQSAVSLGGSLLHAARGYVKFKKWQMS